MPACNKKERKKNIYHTISLVILAAILLVWSSLTLRQNNHFPIKNIQVISSFKHIDRNTLQKTIAPHIENGFFGLEATLLKSKLMQLPWIYGVSIQRKWPYSIVVNLEEQEPLAIWNGNSLINKNGDKFSPTKDSFPSGLPHLHGPEKDFKSILSDYFLMQSILKKTTFKIMEIKIDNNFSWRVLLNDNLTLYLGSKKPVAKFTLFTKIYPRIIANNGRRAQSIDLRYQNGFSIRYHKEPSPLLAPKDENKKPEETNNQFNQGWEN